MGGTPKVRTVGGLTVAQSISKIQRLLWSGYQQLQERGEDHRSKGVVVVTNRVPLDPLFENSNRVSDADWMGKPSEVPVKIGIAGMVVGLSSGKRSGPHEAPGAVCGSPLQRRDHTRG